MIKWYEEGGNNSDIVISSRVRLARNISGRQFSLMLMEPEAKELVGELKEKLADIGNGALGTFKYIPVRELTAVEKVALVERNILSEVLISKEEETGAYVTEDESVSIMLNEEDHIRIQVLKSGLEIKKAWETADAIDDDINRRFAYAYDEQFGYLTSFPTNVGTGMRVSCMLHLPSLAATKALGSVANDISRFGLAIRGISYEKENGVGNLYQLYSQKTLGQSEQDIMKGFKSILQQIVKQERKLRYKHLQEKKDELEDMVYRSYGILRYTRRIKMMEGLNLLSNVNYGVSTGIIELEDEGMFTMYRLLIGMQPANMDLAAGRSLDEDERDIFRAEYLRNSLPKIKL